MKGNIYNYVKWMLDNNLDEPRNTIKGNTKLQKMLFFAQLISIAKNDKLLFNNQFNAFENGMVIEDIRKLYKENLDQLLYHEMNELSDEELDILNLTKEIYGSETAETLSEMSHDFTYWEEYFKRSHTEIENYKDKSKSLVPNKELWREIYRIKDVIDTYYEIKDMNYNDEEEY